MKPTRLQILILGVVALALAACSPSAAIGQAEQEVRSRLPFASASTPGANGSAQAAIQLVIQRGDFEQEQAIRSRDSSVMKDTSTDSYYQVASQQNQDLLDGGVTSIKLIGLDWGPVTVSGNTAKATTYETWTTTYSDGTTDQSRDRNVYTLVQQNGAWKIQADDQPDSGAASPSSRPRPVSPAPSGSPAPSQSPAASASAGTGTAPSGTVQAAIQQVIQKGNSEQEQAISSHDSSVMKDTSTDSYYQDLSQNNQDMLDSGVTGIRVVKIEWGPVTVNGSTATATTFETWTTTYSDGTTDQSRDRNVYTLVQQNGAWKIQSDDHPDDAFISPPGSSQPGAPSPQAPPAPISPAGRGKSSNWSGYVASGGSFTGVTGTWTVPQPSTSGSLGADAAWVGIGGERSRDLIQAGTEETVLSSGRTRFDAWIEMLPQYSHPVPMPVHPGDSVTVSINQQQPGSWLISFKNNTTGATYDRTVQYTSSLSSAEWIEEAPSGRGGVVPLDNFGTVTFSNASAIKDGKTVNPSQANAHPITMINGSDQPLATPSAISSDGSGFAVTRTGNSSGGFGRGSFTSPSRRRLG